MKLYSIKNWHTQFETSETKKYDSLRWVPIPNKHDGLGFRRLAAHNDRCQLLAAWVLILEVASKGKKNERGVLKRDGRPLTAADLSLITGFPESVFVKAFEFFSNPLQGWLVAETYEEPAGVPGGNSGAPEESPGELAGDSGQTCLNRTEQNRTEQKGTLSATEVAPALTDEQWLETLKSDPAYQGIDVAVQYGKMVNWCRENKKQPTRRRFINWLNRCDRPMTADGGHSRAEPPAWLQIRNLEERILQHPANRSSRYNDINATAEQKEELKNLRTELDELKGNRDE